MKHFTFPAQTSRRVKYFSFRCEFGTPNHETGIIIKIIQNIKKVGSNRTSKNVVV